MQRKLPPLPALCQKKGGSFTHGISTTILVIFLDEAPLLIKRNAVIFSYVSAALRFAFFSSRLMRQTASVRTSKMSMSTKRT